LPGRELEKEENDNCEGKGFTYSEDVKQIINTSCAISDCHVEGNTQNLPHLLNYMDVFDLRGKIGNRVGSRTMPPSSAGISLSNAEINAIVCWVKSGSPE
jgi:hypothetical protein